MDKARMRGWTLAALAGLGWAIPATAQVAPATVAARTASAPVISDSLARLMELKVEMAWLGNKDTFPYPLAVRVDGNSVVVGGQVPNQAIRQQALILATQETGLQAVDRVSIEPSPIPLPTRVSYEKICLAAVESLNQGYKQYANQFVVDADADGRITISGEVPSYEEKLAISRRLSRVPSCQCVKNQLTVRKVQIDGRMYARLSADGQQMVLDESAPALTPSLPTMQTATMPINQQPTGPSVQPAVFYPNPTPSTSERPSSTPSLRPSVPPLGPNGRPRSPYGARTLPDVKPAAPATTVTAAWAPTPAASQPSPSMIQTVANRNPVVTTTPAGVVIDPRVVTANASAAPSLTPPPVPLQTVTAPGSGAIGLVNPAAMQPVVNPISASAHSFLKSRIERTCSGSARSVEVLAPTDSTLLIRLRVRDPEKGGELINKIINLPEILPFQEQVSFEVHVIP